MARSIALQALLILFIGSIASAENLVSDPAALEQVEIQGISLSMTAEEAFETLREAGYQAGDLDTYADWTTDGVQFVRGIYGSPEGYSDMTMTRRGDRIVQITETFNSPGSPLDANAEIGAVKRQLGLPADSNRCRTNGANGSCQVQDADAPEDVNIAYTLQVLSTMRMVGITRTKELR
jgi:hypothetical protein